jgi:hypothetical protein
LTVGTLLALGAALIYPAPAAPREMAAVLPFSAVLAGRLLAERLAAARLVPVMVVVLCLYLVTLSVNVTSTPEVNDYRPLASWLSDHGLRYGLATYNLASTLTLTSGDHVKVRPTGATAHSLQVYPRLWEADKWWYDPSLHDANFFVEPERWAGPQVPGLRAVLHTFGPPALRYKVDGAIVMVWDYNLLTRTKWGHHWPSFDPSA